MLRYKLDPQVMELIETRDDGDNQFRILLLQEGNAVERFKRVLHRFESDKDYTDVLFYSYPNHEYNVIVQPEHRTAFLTELLKERLLISLEWEEEDNV